MLSLRLTGFSLVLFIAGAAHADDPVGISGGSELSESELRSAAAVIAPSAEVSLGFGEEPQIDAATAQQRATALGTSNPRATRKVVTSVQTIYGVPDKVTGTDQANDKFANVQVFDYATGDTTNHVVNVTKNSRVESQRTSVNPPIAEEERTVILALVLADPDVVSTLGADIARVRVHAVPTNGKSFRTTRAARVTFELDDRQLPLFKYVDLKNEKIVKARR